MSYGRKKVSREDRMSMSQSCSELRERYFFRQKFAYRWHLFLIIFIPYWDTNIECDSFFIDNSNLFWHLIFPYYSWQHIKIWSWTLLTFPSPPHSHHPHPFLPFPFPFHQFSLTACCFLSFIPGEYVAQFKFTLLIMPNGPIRLEIASIYLHVQFVMK